MKPDMDVSKFLQDWLLGKRTPRQCLEDAFEAGVASVRDKQAKKDFPITASNSEHRDGV